MDFYKLSKLGVKARWKKEHNAVKEHIKSTHHNFLKEKARLIGYVMGDGSITANDSPSKGSHHDIRFYPDDLQMVNLFVKDFEKLYLKKPVIRKLKNYFSVYSSSKPAWEDLKRLGDFTSLNWEFPYSLLSKEEKIEWLRAMFDCEAYVDTKKKRISFQTVSKQGASSVQNLLKEFGISSKIYIYKRKNPKWNTNYLLFVSGKENVYNFSEKIGFNHSLKKKKLSRISQRAGVVNGTVSKTVPFGAPRFES